MTIKHKYTLAVADSGDSSVVQPSNWNDDHAIDSAGLDVGSAIPLVLGGTNATNVQLGHADCNVGIGTTSPSSKVTIMGPAGVFTDAANSLRLEYDGGNAAGAVGAGLVFAQRYDVTDTAKIRVGGIYGYKHAATSGFGGGLQFYTQPAGAADMSERMRIDSAGSVGIGSAPDAKFHVYGNADNSIYLQPAPASNTNPTLNARVTNSAGKYFGIAVRKGVTPDGVYDGAAADVRMVITGDGYVGIGTLAPVAKLAINGGLHVGGDSDPGDNNLLADGTITATGGFSGNVTGTSTNATNVAVTNDTSTSSDQYVTFVGASTGNTGVKTHAATFKYKPSTGVATATDFVASSDARMKENVVTISNALAKVTAMRGVNYNLIDDVNKKRQMGVIAQEVSTICPELIVEDSEGKLAVSYGHSVGVLIEAIKDLKKIVDAQASEIAALKAGR